MSQGVNPHTRRSILVTEPFVVVATGTTRSHGYIFCLLPFVILMLGVPCG